MNKRMVTTRLLGSFLFLLVAVIAAFGALRRTATPDAKPASKEGRDRRDGASPPSEPVQDSVQAFYDSLAALEERIPPEAVDLKALARRLGGDPAGLAQFVADSIRYEHYDGVLRGAFGVLISRSGNSCDQALFLGELLAAHGMKSRLRVAPADRAVNAALVERAIREAPAGLSDQARGVRDSLRAEVELHLGRLSAAAPGFAAALETPAEPHRIQHSCWVEAEVAGSRLDLDPLAISGSGAAAETHSAVPASLRFQVAVSVLLDGESSGRADTTVLTSVTFGTDTLRLDPILISVVPERADLLDSLKAGMEPGTVLEALDTFYPVVTFRDEHHVGKGFNLAGEIVELGKDAVLAGGAQLGERLGDMLAGGMAGAQRRDAEAQPTAGRKLVGVRLIYEVRFPDGRVESTQRQLVSFDEAPSGANRAIVLTSIVKQKQLLVSTSSVSAWYLARRLVDSFRENRGALEFLVRLERGSSEQPPALHPYPFQLLLLAMAEDGASRQLNEPGRSVLFRARPEIVVFRQEYAVDSAGVRRIDAIDIATTGFEALSIGGRAKTLRAMMGIYSSLFEVLMLVGPTTESLLSLIRQAHEESIPVVTLTGASDPQLEGLQLTTLQRHAILEELSSGRIVVTPARPVRGSGTPALGWWRLDPGTGDVLAVLETREGGAQQATEYTLVKGTIVGAVVGAASGYAICLMDNLQDAGWQWQSWQGRDGECVVAAYCGGLLGAIFGLLVFARPVPVYMQIAPPYMAWSGPTQTVVAYIIPSLADIMGGAGLIGGVGGGLWSNLACVALGGGGLARPPARP